MTKIGEIPIKTRRWMRLVFAAREPGDMTLCSHCAEMEIFMDKRTVHRVRSAQTDYKL